MTVTPQGLLYLCKTPLENDYKNQLTFDNLESQLDYFNSTIKQSFSEYTYIKKYNQVTVGANIDKIIDCNYLFYQNLGFTNKYYFCFITNMEYISEEVTRITFETDCFQTWQFNIKYNECFVEREHVNNDVIGLHTVPENLETGDYIMKDDVKSNINNAHPVVALTYDITRGDVQYPYQQHNGIPSGLHYYLIGDFTSVNGIGYITTYLANEGKLDSLVTIFMVPDNLTDYNNIEWDYFLTEGGFQYAPYKKLNGTTTTAIEMETISINKPYLDIDGYIPKNKKLFTYPYQYLMIDNNGGSSGIYNYEYFNDVNINFKIKGDITPGCSIRCYPINYKNITENNSEGLNGSKYPICSWTNDIYTNWLTQNGVNIGTSVASSLLATSTGIITGNIVGTASGLIAISNTLGEVYQHSLIPPQIEGNINSGDVNYSNGNCTFNFYRMNIKNEYAQIIDNYFSMFGYKINRVKIPNITGRKNWNFVKTIDCNFSGDIPQNDINIIKTMFNNGVTFWHNPNTIYNYLNDNNII